MKVTIIILCLRRSGSTTLWKVFRKDSRFLCFDEPFNPMLKDLPKLFLKKTNVEFINLYNKDANFKNIFSPINLEEELSEFFTDRQRKYFQYLLNRSNMVVMDITRAVFKVKDIYNLAPDAFLIHLYRLPQAFVTSHILPNRLELKPMKILYYKTKFKYMIHKKFFWKVKRNYNDWGYEVLCNLLPKSDLIKKYKIKYDSKWPAYKKLLAFWKLSFEFIENNASSLYKERFISLPFEEFANNPYHVIKKIYDIIGLKCPFGFTDFSWIKKPNLGYNWQNNKWYEAFKKLEININELYERAKIT